MENTVDEQWISIVLAKLGEIRKGERNIVIKMFGSKRTVG